MAASFDWFKHSLAGDTKDGKDGGLGDGVVLLLYDPVKLSIVRSGVVISSESWKQFLSDKGCEQVPSVPP